ncbi:MAG TPA: iron-containing alcohol dehydrogenase [Bacteroidales bacterium]|nr:iron-containing alcohol dehydrogenase [Bacteroidales bacterium]
MIKPFQFSGMPKIVFGNGVFSRLHELAKPYGNRVLLVTGKGSFLASRHFQALKDTFSKSNTEFRIARIPSEPTPQMIDEAVAENISFNPGVVVAIGGGSVMDAGKAVSAMLPLNEPVVDYLEEIGNKEHPGKKIPFIAVPTTSGTGSEATKNAVISQTGKNGFKKSIRHDNFVPDIALVDPELSHGCPADITAASGMDCFSQLTEAYLSTKSGNYTDALAMEGFMAIKHSLLKVYRDRHNAEARTGMSFAALTSGLCLANAGLGTVHGFASSIGGLFDIPHGVVCGTLMASGNEVNVRKLRTTGDNPEYLKKYTTLGRLFIDESGKSDDYYIAAFISYLHELTDILNLPHLGKFGITQDHIEAICASTGNKNNPVKLEKEDLAEIISSRLSD